MQKVIVAIANHPVIRLFLQILALVLYPVHSLLVTPVNEKKVTTTFTTPPEKKVRDNIVEENDTESIRSEEENDIDETDDNSLSTISAETDDNKLFPTIDHTDNTKPLTSSSIKPCSTGISPNFLPFKNEQGEIEWAFTEESNGIPLAAVNAGVAGVGGVSNVVNININSNSMKNQISPTVSNSSNSNSYTNSDKIFDIDESFSDSQKQAENFTPSSLNTPSPPNSTGKNSNISGNGDLKCHQCPHCEATFKLRGYLTRHLKKHSLKKAYSCPFHKFLIYIDESNVTHKCHPSGGFSRRDTYKTHLKSRHFKYPKGTKTKERSKTAGNCSMCGEHFPNSEIWCEIHIEGGECKFLPVGFKGKSRIKNRLRKQLKKKGIDIDANGNPKGNFNFSSYISNNLESLGNLDLDLDLENDADGDSNNESNDNESFNDEHNGGGSQKSNSHININTSSSPNEMSDFSQSPFSDHEVIHNKFAGGANLSPESNSNHPIDKSMNSQQTVSSNNYQIVDNEIPRPSATSQQYNIPTYYPEPQPVEFSHPHPVMPDSQQQQQLQFQSRPYLNDFNEYYNVPDTYMYKFLDYDDEFCLDVDQLNQFTPKSLDSPQSTYKGQGYPQSQQYNNVLYQSVPVLSTAQSSFSSQSSVGQHPQHIHSQAEFPSQEMQVPPKQPQQSHPQHLPNQKEQQSHIQMGQNMGMNTGMNLEDVHFDQYNLQAQPQYVQY